jgi:Domain of unknown function (DUF5703)/Concanavalin A-like lectin/glucanases superfamily
MNRLLVLCAVTALSTSASFAGAPAELDRYNVVWKTPSGNAAGSMPIGNGEVGLNVWVEEDGDLRFYIARTDAWSEASRLLKLGGIRVSLTPNPFAKGASFQQILRLRDGCIEITAGDDTGPQSKIQSRVHETNEVNPKSKILVFVDANAPVIHVAGESGQPLGIRAALECWRTEKKVLTDGELGSSWTPPEVEVWESADVVKDASDAVAWYHRNEHSCVPLTLKLQSLETFANLVKDPILHRTFGGSMTAAGFVKDGATAMKSSAPMKRFAIRIATHSAVTATAAVWEKQLAKIAASSGDAVAAEKSTAAWWNGFWNRSWVFVEGDPAAVSSLPANAYPLRIGADSNGGSKFRGAMSRATVFGRALGDAEIASLAAGKPGDAAAIAEGRTVGWRFTGAPDGAKVVGAMKFEEQDGVAVAAFGGGHLEVPNETCHGLTNSFTLEAWIRPDAKAGSARIFDKLTAGKGDGFLFDTHPGRSLRLIAGQSTMAINDALQPGAWNHVAVVYDAEADGRRIYLNGRLLKAEGGGGMEQPTPSMVTRAYVLQRWMAACAGRGSFPTKFNGSIFTVDPEFTDPKQKFNPDWRRWGDCFWWQNTRFPAWAAVANGDYDLCAAVFRMYRDALPICKARAKFYYGAGGAYFPETMTSFGTYANRDYGWDRTGKQPGDIACGYWRFAWQQGLELVALMLDCYERTLDEKFLTGELVPMAREVLRYFDTRFQRDAHGKLVISPAQAVETYWFDVVNDTPSVAGLNAVLDRLLALPRDAVSAADREFWARMKAAAPHLPVRSEDGRSFVLPAEKFDPKRSNCENPELYAVWPFRLFAVGRPGLETGVETFNRRIAKIMTGWCYDGQCAALLGLTDEARKQILAKVRNSHRNFRFPAMWGPNFDWLPDQDHGCNILLTLQHMILNTDGDRIYLLPAWPKDWNLHFKLHAPRRTTVEGRVHDGKLVDLVVTPASRRKDVVLSEPQ